MAADILTQEQDFTIAVEDSRGMDPTGAIEDILGSPEFLRQLTDNSCANDRSTCNRHAAAGTDGIDARLAADTATAARVEIPFDELEIERNSVAQHHSDDVEVLLDIAFGAVADPGDITLFFDDSLRQQETRRQVRVVPGGPHRHGDGTLLPAIRFLPAESDFKRLFSGDRVDSPGGLSVPHATDLALLTAAGGTCRWSGIGRVGVRGGGEVV